MKVALADIDEEKLIETSKKCSEILGANNVLTVTTDVSKLDQVVKLRDRVYEAWGEVISSFILRSYYLPAFPFYLWILCTSCCTFWKCLLICS